MLVIERTVGSTLCIGRDIRISVKEIPGSRRVRLGLEVPKGTLIWREEAGLPKALDNIDPPKATLNVLIVEDDEDHALLIEKGFARAGSAVTRTVARADEALALLLREVSTTAMPNLVLVDLDLGLGRMDGIELVEEIKRHHAFLTLPTVILSGVAQPRQVSAAFAAGANAFLHKTDDYTEFSDLIVNIADFWRQNIPDRSVGRATGEKAAAPKDASTADQGA